MSGHVPNLQSESHVPAEQVRMILRHVQTLPTLAPVATKILAMQDESGVDLGSIARLVETDPVLSGRILGLCRRADKGVKEKITSVRRAVVLVGFGAVRSAVLGASAFTALGEKPESQAPESFDRTGFWRYCVCVACTAELLAAQNKSTLKVAPDEAFVAGLLHAIGKLVLDHVLPKAYLQVLALAKRECSPSSAIERRVLGLDYHNAGKALADHWQLPAALGEVMLLHATPAQDLPETDHKNLVALISGSAAFVRGLGLGWSGDFDSLPNIPLLLPGSNVRAPDMTEFGEKLLRALADRLAALGLSDAGPEAIAIESMKELARQNGELQRQVRDLSLAGPAGKDTSPAPAQSQEDPQINLNLDNASQTRAARCLLTVTSKTQLLAMRLHDSRDRAGALAIVEAARELESILQSSAANQTPDESLNSAA